MKVFISSTLSDLLEYRQAARRAITRVGLEPILLEEVWGTIHPTGRQSEIAKRVHSVIDECDVFVGIIGSRAGALIPGTGTPWTVHEAVAATAAGKLTFFYVTSQAVHVSEDSDETKQQFLASVTSSKLIQFVTSPDQFAVFLRRDLSSFLAGLEPQSTAKHISLVPIQPSDFQTLLTHPEELQKCSSRFFEELVAELLAADGWEVELIARNNAPGPDIIAVSS